MHGLAAPFGRRHHGPAAVWPAAGDPGPVRRTVPADRWLDPFESYDGETALEDLDAVGGPSGAARILARYLIIRVLCSAAGPRPGCSPAIDRLAARSFLESLAPDDPDRVALSPFIEHPTGRILEQDLASRLQAVAAAGRRHDLSRSTFALLRAGYVLARSAHRHREAGLIARQLAGIATAAGARPAARRWALRARAAERRGAR